MQYIKNTVMLNSRTGRVAKVAIGVVIAFVAVYLYEVNSIIGAMLQAKNMSTRTQTVQQEYQALETSYLSLVAELTEARVTALGFVPQEDGAVVERARVVLSLRSY